MFNQPVGWGVGGWGRSMVGFICHSLVFLYCITSEDPLKPSGGDFQC